MERMESLLNYVHNTRNQLSQCQSSIQRIEKRLEAIEAGVGAILADAEHAAEITESLNDETINDSILSLEIDEEKK